MNEQLAPFFEKLARKAPVQSLLRRTGLDPRQFASFLELFRTLSEREEFMGIVGVDRFSLSYLALFIAAMEVIACTLIAAIHSIAASMYMMMHLAVTFILIFVFISREAANTLFNPVEASMLAHKPVHGPTYAAAKIAHIFIAVLYLVSGLTLYPALAGVLLKGARWFLPITHSVASYLIGFWAAFLICAFYGLMRRVAPANWLKSFSIWVQLLVPILFVFILYFFPQALARILSSALSWLPLNWIVGIGLLGCQGSSWRFGRQEVISIIVTVVIVWFGLRSFSGSYFAETVSILEGGFRGSGKHNAFSRCCAEAAGLLTGSPVGIGAFFFVSKMVRRDWQYRRAALSMAWAPLFGVLLIAIIIVHSGFPPPPISSSQDISPAHFLPHLLGILAMTLCVSIPFTDFQNGVWIYLTTPFDNLRAFARGIYWALWVPVGLPYLIFLPFMIGFWGWREAMVVFAYSLIVISLYLGFSIKLISALPFSSPLNQSRTMIKGTIIQIFYISAMMMAMFQFYLFHSWRISILSGIGLTVLAWFIVRWALGDLEKELLWRLHILKMGPNQIFKEIE